MSWKSLVTAGLLCVMASPVMAVPTLVVTGSRLTKPTVPANAVRVWNIAIAPDTTLSGGATSIALEIGFTATGGNILSISSAQNATRVLDQNPGNKIFGGETLTDVDPGVPVNNQPVGLQLGSAWTVPDATKAFAAIGTAVFPDNKKYDLFTITTQQTVTALAWGGAFSTAGAYLTPNGSIQGVARIAQKSGAGAAQNYQDATYGSSMAVPGPNASRFLGDMNGDGNINGLDAAAFGSALTNVPAYTAANPSLNRIGRCDVNGDGNCNGLDATPLASILTGGGNPGLGSGSAVPEPASLVLMGLVAMGGLGVRRRRG